MPEDFYSTRNKPSTTSPKTSPEELEVSPRDALLDVLDELLWEEALCFDALGSSFTEELA